MKAYYENLEEHVGIMFEEIRPILKLVNPLHIREYKDKEVNSKDIYFIVTPGSIEVYKFNS